MDQQQEPRDQEPEADDVSETPPCPNDHFIPFTCSRCGGGRRTHRQGLLGGARQVHQEAKLFANNPEKSTPQQRQKRTEPETETAAEEEVNLVLKKYPFL
jgi:hypothetical protein